MLGDQLHTDIAGAHAAGIASALVLTGLSTRESLRHVDFAPTYLMERLGG